MLQPVKVAAARVCVIMKILMIAINDPAGTAIEFTKAINKYTEHTCRLITKEIRYNFMFEKDLHLPWLGEEGWEEVEKLLRTSDVFHFHMTADEYIELGPFKPADHLRGKIIIHHHHGHPDFRGNPEKYRRKYREWGRKNLMVSTPDLMKLLPGARWQPNLVPVNDPLYRPMHDKPDKPIIIGHSPTRKELKNTSEFVQAVKILKRKTSIPIEMRLIENKAHKECLRLKRECHVLFDHLQGYFGVSSLEGLSQGLCVIAGLDDWTKDNIINFCKNANNPWVDGNRKPLEEVILGLVADAEKRKAIGEQARMFMKKHWSDEKIACCLSSYYSKDVCS